MKYLMILFTFELTRNFSEFFRHVNVHSATRCQFEKDGITTETIKSSSLFGLLDKMLIYFFVLEYILFIFYLMLTKAYVLLRAHLLKDHKFSELCG